MLSRTCTIFVCFRWKSFVALAQARSWGCNGSPGRSKHCCPHATAYEWQFFNWRFKTKQSKAPIPVPEQARPVIAAWQKLSKDSSPEALTFPHVRTGNGRDRMCGVWGKNFLRWRIRPSSRKLDIPIVTFQVMRAAGSRHAAARDAEGHPRACYGTRASRRLAMLRSDDRTECSCRRELARVSGPPRLDDARYGFRPELEKPERSDEIRRNRFLRFL